MSKYIFMPQEDESLGVFEIEGASFEDAVNGLAFELQCHDEWQVVTQAGGVYAVDLFLKRHYIDTLLVSELPPNKAYTRRGGTVANLGERSKPPRG